MLSSVIQPIYIKSRSSNYGVHFLEKIAHQELFRQHLANKQILIISDENVAKHYLQELMEELADFDIDSLVLPAGEEHKSLGSVEQVTTKLIQSGYTKNTVLLALGGGMVGDLTGLCAALYQRGVDYIQLPTSLLAQIDSSLGGKTAVNHILGKNMLGMVLAPRDVFIDIGMLATLPDREYRSALSEAIKYGLLFDASFFDWIEDNIEVILERERSVVLELVSRSCGLKAHCVQEDEFDQNNYRALLNLGHTLAHAIEQLTEYKHWLHGEAVGIGLVFAVHLSSMQGYLSSDSIDRVLALLKNIGLPTMIDIELDLAELINSMRRDKKNSKGQFKFILLQQIGEPIIDTKVSIDSIKSAIKVIWRK